MATKNQKVHGIIHMASVACAGIGGGMAQVPGSDSVAIVPIQTGMIIAIADQHGFTITKLAAADLLLTFAATMGGRFLSQVLVGWVPAFGNAINASTAAALTEAIGWAADSYFDETEAKATSNA